VNAHGHVDPEISATATDWLSAVDSPDKENLESPAVGEQEDAAAQENEASSAT
jgi:hypothetical protein